MPTETVVDTFDGRWARWQAAAAIKDRRWQRAAMVGGAIVGTGVLTWLALTLVGV